MLHTEGTVVIRASMSRVFDLIARPNKFAKYCKHVVKVAPISRKAHHWNINLAGLPLEWDSFITELKRPKYLAWRSSSSIKNSGSYTLTQTKAGTKVTCEIDYDFPSKLLTQVAAPVLEPLIHGAMMDVLEGIKAELESPSEPGERSVD